MNRSHLLPAHLVALAALAVAQSTQNQSNIARLVNVINQVTASVDGVVPFRDHQTIRFQTSNPDDDGPVPVFRYEVPAGFRAQVRYLGGSTFLSLYLEEPGAELLIGSTGNSVAALQSRDLWFQDLTYDEGSVLKIPTSGNYNVVAEGIMTVILQEI